MSSSSSSSSNSPCAACKFLRRKCIQECIFAPYFPSDDPQKFASVHKVFGASNVSKLLNELNSAHRRDAVESLAYEAEARLRDPVYGCVGLISVLQHKLRQVQSETFNAKKELSTFIGPQAMLPMMIQPIIHPFMPQQQHLGNPSSSSNNLMNGPMMGIPTLLPQQQQQMYEAQQLGAARAQETLSVYEAQQRQQQQQQEEEEFIGFNQMDGADTAMSPELTLGTFDCQYQIQQGQHPLQEQLMFQTQQRQKLQQHQMCGRDEGRSGGLP